MSLPNFVLAMFHECIHPVNQGNTIDIHLLVHETAIKQLVNADHELQGWNWIPPFFRGPIFRVHFRLQEVREEGELANF